VILLVSADFIASDYCYAREMVRAMAMHEQGQASVVPVIVRPVDWTAAPFAKLKALPRDGKAITSWKNRDEAYVDIARSVRAVIESTNAQSRTNVEGVFGTRSVESYQGSVLQVGGTGSRLVTKTAWLLTEHEYLDADEFITHFFNGGGDILWVSCPPEFSIQNATSPTGNEVFAMAEGDQDTPYGLMLKDQVQNTIVITCSRKPNENIDVPRATGTLYPRCNGSMAAFQQYCIDCGFQLAQGEPEIK
jgi:hypothetical protein